MKILVLEHPRIASEKRFNDIANTPLWSCLMGGYAAAALAREGFDTEFLDHAVPGADFNTTKEKILALNPDFLCVNAVYFWEHTPVLFDFFTSLRQHGFSGHLNLFGFFPSLVHKEILLNCDCVDSIAVGEFEHSLVELAKALDRGQSFDNIQGLASKFGFSGTCRRQPEKNPDRFAFPKRSSLERTAAVLASRGCYNHCSFCPVPSFYNQGSLWKGRSPENIAKEVQELVDQGIKDFYFVDPNFIGPGKTGKKRVMALMNLFVPMDIRFGIETRPQDLDDDILAELVAAGFQSLLMGVESGSAAVLNQINKSAGPHVASRAISLCRKHGIEPEIGFLMFVPDARLDDLFENMKFLMENNLLARLDRTANLLSHTQIVLAGTLGYRRFEQENRLVKNGIFGFEAEVTFFDPKVKWVAELVTFACHTLLRSMSDKNSPIYWKNTDNLISRRANAFLKEESLALLARAKTHSRDLGETAREKRKILNQVTAILTQGMTKAKTSQVFAASL